MKPKKDSILHRDFMIAKLLAVITFFMFIFSILLEFNIIIVYEHKGFIINVLLGLSASSAIAFISVYLPTKSKLDSEVRKIAYNCIHVLRSYKGLIKQLQELCRSEVIEENIKFSLLGEEKLTISMSDRLVQEIKTYYDCYEYGEIESMKVSRLFLRYNNGLCRNLETIKGFCNTIISLVNGYNTDEEKDTNIALYKRLINDYVDILLVFLEEVCPFEDLDNALRDAFPQKRKIESELRLKYLIRSGKHASEISYKFRTERKDYEKYSLYDNIRKEWSENKAQAYINKTDGLNPIKPEQQSE